MNSTSPVIEKILIEERQGHETRLGLYQKLEKHFQKPVISYFTSFVHPVMIDDSDAEMIEGILQKIDLSKGFVLFVNSPGGLGMAAERIVNISRAYSKTGKFETLVAGKAKSAATMICFGSEKIVMGPTAELGPVDPQVALSENGVRKRFSVFNIIQSYDDLFKRAVREKKGNLQPYLQQLGEHYDARQIREWRSVMDLSEDISVRSLKTGMLTGIPDKTIKAKLKIFLTPEHTKHHGRPIYSDEALSRGLKIQKMTVTDPAWQDVYEMYIRLSRCVNGRCAKIVESSANSFHITAPNED